MGGRRSGEEAGCEPHVTPVEEEEGLGQELDMELVRDRVVVAKGRLPPRSDPVQGLLTSGPV
jgi:hypothetical protein